MDHLRPARPHDERGLLDGVVADGEDQVGAVDRLVDVVALRERGGSHVEVGAAGDRALAHLRGKERQLQPSEEAVQSGREPWAARAGTEHYEGALRLEDHCRGPV